MPRSCRCDTLSAARRAQPSLEPRAPKPRAGHDGLLLSPNRGLLVFSPIFAFSLVFAVHVVPVLMLVTAVCRDRLVAPNNIDYHHERLWDISDGEIARC